MRLETSKEAQQIQIPPFVNVLKEVTSMEQYETRSMASLSYKMPEEDKTQIEAKLNDCGGHSDGTDRNRSNSNSTNTNLTI